MRRSRDIEAAQFALKDVLHETDCAIYWYPTVTAVYKDFSLLSQDKHKVLIVADAYSEQEFHLPVDMMVIMRGDMKTVAVSALSLHGEALSIQQNPGKFSDEQVHIIRLAIKKISDYKSSAYYDLLEKGNEREWNIHRARVCSEYSYLGEERTDEVIRYDKTKERK